MNEPSHESEKPKLTVIRWIFAIFGGLIMLFCGGCTLVLLAEMASKGKWRDNYVSVEMILVIGGVPFLFGLLIWWLAVKAGRS